MRELRNHVERAVSLGLIAEGEGSTDEARPVRAPSVPAELVPLHLPLKEARAKWMEDLELVYVRAMLEATGGNLTRAAERAGVSRRFLQRTLARLRHGGAWPTSDDE